MNDYSVALNTYFDNLSNEIEQYKKNPYNYRYSQSNCYQNGFSEFCNIIQERYSSQFKIKKLYETMNGSSKHIDPYILLKFYNNKIQDGLYLYIKLPSEPNKKYVKISLELGRTQRYSDNNKIYLLNLNKIYNLLKVNIEGYKDKLENCSNINSLGENNNLLEAYVSDFTKIDDVLSIFIGLYITTISHLNITDWEDSWEEAQKNLFGDSYIGIKTQNTITEILEEDKEFKYNIDEEKFEELKRNYLNDFDEYIQEELYKWQAIKTFNNKWNLNVSNDEFANMIKESLKDSDNILTAYNYYPYRMIVSFAEKDPIAVKMMFEYLYDETKDLYDRIKKFSDKSDELLEKYFEEGKSHYQDMHVISTYLGFRYPEKYYLFKSSSNKKALKYIGIEINNQDKIEELINYFDVCNEIRKKLISDENIINSIKNTLDDECCKSDNYHILTWDFLYYSGRVYLKRKEEQVEEIKEETKIENQEWIIPANPNLYDHDASFEKNGVIDWRQGANFNIGDIVYLYITRPEQRISTKTIVKKVNLTSQEALNDSEFYRNPNFVKVATDRFVRLQKIESYDDPRLGIEYLVKHGINGAPQSAMRVPKELSDYIKSVTKGEKMLSKNIIYYGGPGCGKSKFVEDTYCKENNYIRTTFYPDYTNSDFVGQLVPKYNKEKEKLEYVINPGPFTKALEKAYENTNRNIYLIIEEINRGNAAAIFGDIFQLLDRNNETSDKEIGASTYEINNNIIEEYLGVEKVTIPANLSIIATMNTSDQNVYTLDSAFKRRWNMVYISNEFDDSIPYDNKIGNKYVPMKNCDITWKDFIEVINNCIVSIDTYGIHSEDKQIGKYFVGEFDLLDRKVEEYDDASEAIKTFSEKVLMYLWEDIAKLDQKRWFDENIKTLNKLLKEYSQKGIDVFSVEIKEKLKEKITDEEEKKDSTEVSDEEIISNE